MSELDPTSPRGFPNQSPWDAPSPGSNGKRGRLEFERGTIDRDEEEHLVQERDVHEVAMNRIFSPIQGRAQGALLWAPSPERVGGEEVEVPRPRARLLFGLMDDAEQEEELEELELMPTLGVASPLKRRRQLSEGEARQVAGLLEAFAGTELGGLEARSLAILLVTGEQDEMDQIHENIRWHVSRALSTPNLRAHLSANVMSRLAALAGHELFELHLGGDDAPMVNSLTHLPRLQILGARNCSLDTTFMRRVKSGAAQQLVTLDLTFLPELPKPDFTVSREAARMLCATESLERLLLGGRSWADDDLLAQVLPNNPHLQALYLNRLAEVTDHTCELLAAHNPLLTELNLDETGVTDLGVGGLVAGCPLLDNISFAGTEITDAAAVHLGGLRGLQRIGLEGCRHIGDAGIEALVSNGSRLIQINLPFWQEDDDEGQWALRSGVTARGMRHLLENATQLQELTVGLGSRGVLDVMVEELPRDLHVLVIRSAPEMTNADLQRIMERCPNLQHLYVHNAPNLTIAGLRASEHLEGLALPFTSVGEEDHAAIRRLFPKIVRIETE